MYENVFYTGEYTIENNELLYRASMIRKVLSFAARFIPLFAGSKTPNLKLGSSKEVRWEINCP
ncbi:hypothetical protein DT250_22685 [Bacillus sp. AR2-1]|nr:hypothetical protein DT250_22685 [Bacillus sp. AR2-1]